MDKTGLVIMNKLPSFPRPSPHLYQIMSDLFCDRTGEHDNDHFYADDHEVEASFGKKASAIDLMPPKLLESILDVLKLSFAGTRFKNLDQLNTIIDREVVGAGADDEPAYHLNQRNAIVHSLYFAARDKRVNWGHLVNILNGLDTHEVSKVRDFFEFMGSDLEALLDAGQLGFDMPESEGSRLPRQEFSGSTFVRDPAQAGWIREDVFSSKFCVHMRYEAWDSEEARYAHSGNPVAYAGTLEDALLLSGLYLDNMRKYYKSLSDYRESIAEDDKTPTFISINTDQGVIVRGKLKVELAEADDRQPDSQHRHMITVSNTWFRRIGPDLITDLSTQIDKDKATWRENTRGDTFDQTLRERIHANEEKIKMCNFHIDNKDLEMLIFKTDTQLGSYKHKTKYFIEELGI